MSSWQERKDQSFCKEGQHVFITFGQSLSSGHHPFASEKNLMGKDKNICVQYVSSFYKTSENRAVEKKKTEKKTPKDKFLNSVAFCLFH